MSPQPKHNGYENPKARQGRPIYKTLEEIVHPLPGEEIVISGISGSFPESENVNELRDNLFAKRNLLTKDNRRWNVEFSDIPAYCGKLKEIEKFDAGYFGITYKDVHYMDPSSRMCLEKAVECIIDAGVNPHDLEGTKCGVFLGVGDTERENEWCYNAGQNHSKLVVGCQKSTVANRISYFLKLKGPSYTCDTACSTALFAIEDAFLALREGICDSAIVGGSQLCIHPFSTLQFASLGVLSFGSTTNTFDVSANGYTRSETVSCIFLQKAKDARRNYGQILHIKSNCDGYKPEGITFPNRHMQSQVMQEVYDETHIDPTLISYLEAHGTSTKVGDPEEVASTSKIYCSKPRPPLLIGSIKSNLGHSEYASGMCSVAKVIIAAETGLIPPNINFHQPKDEMEAIIDGRMKVVTEPTPFQDDRGLIAINNFGFGGVNVHLLMRWNPKVKVNDGLPRDNLPRIICVSGRTRQAVETLFDECSLDAEYIALLNNVFRSHVVGHNYRGYSIKSKKGEITRSIEYYPEEQRKLNISFGLFNEWQDIGRELMEIPVFSGTMNSIHNILSIKNINITDIITTTSKKQHKAMDFVLGNMAVSLGIADLLRTVGLHADCAFGSSLGALIAGYFNGCISLEETVMLSYELAYMVKDDQDFLLPQIIEKKLVTNGVTNGAATGELKHTQNGVMSNGSVNDDDHYLLNGTSLAEAEKQLQDSFSHMLKKVKGQSAANLLNAVKSSVNIEKIKTINERHSVLLQIGSLDIQQKQNGLKNSIINFNREHSESILKLLETLGKIYNYGFSMNINAIYPEIDYPVARGTPMIAPHIKWNHEEDWYVNYYKPRLHAGISSAKIDIQDKKVSYVTGHVIDGLNLFPATGYLFLVWEAMCSALDKLVGDLVIEFENCRFNRATTVPKEGFIKLEVVIQKGTGNFEVSEGRTCIVTGKVKTVDKCKFPSLPKPQGTPVSEALPLLTKDIYKELKLRGYHYKDLFKSMVECDNGIEKAMIRWTENWVTFMDNMLQMQILQYDTRALYVPTYIERLKVDAPKHMQLIRGKGVERVVEETHEQETDLIIEELPQLPVYAYNDLNIIRCGGIEIMGLHASPITRRKPLGEPVLEKYEFVPNDANIPIEVSTRVNMQIILENNYTVKFNVIELIDEATKKHVKPLSPFIAEAFGNLPLISPNITIFSDQLIDVDNIEVENKTLVGETDCLLVVGTNILTRKTVQSQVLGALMKDGFVLSREPLEFDPFEYKSVNLTVLTTHDIGTEKLILAKKSTSFTSPTIISVTQPDFSWLEDLKQTVSNGNNVIVYAQNEDINGVIGLCNCLRLEVGSQKVRCFSIVGKEAPAFNIEHEFYKRQLEKNLTINVFKNGQWGTYRHLMLGANDDVDCEHSYAEVTVWGDLSSIKWIEGPLSSKNQPDILEKTLVHVYYSALNFKDVMVASGRINPADFNRKRNDTDGLLGIEYSGKTTDGTRVMGMVEGGGISNIVAGDSNLLFEVPNYWSLQDAATVTCVYSTVLYAFYRAGGVRTGTSLLIHSGAGGVGQAAINIALHHGCEIFTTVGSPEKLEFIRKTFPQIPESHIGNSRDLTFEDTVMKQTEGRGVDIVLNSLAEEKLIASVRCLAQGGCFLEIGKFDLIVNNKLNLLLLEKDASHHGIMVDQLMKATPTQKLILKKLFTEGLKNGSIKPLKRHLFQKDKVEEAFRFMAAGKHIGKVLIEVRKEEAEKKVAPRVELWKGLPMYYCNPNKCYIVCGGLGGFGLELADWLVLRGARKLVLTSRKGVRNGYQAYRIKIWKSYGTEVKISTKDITTRQGCLDLIKESNSLGPVNAIFNLAVVLEDALIENQTAEFFNTSFAPKAYATSYLDELSREHCPELRDFVVFSSVSCGRGNVGQTNYGMANSVMEKICEKRREEGYPAVAIEWGAVGDVGLVADMQEEDKELEIGGTLQQRITSCLEVMDVFLRQGNPIVSSMVVAEKKLALADNCVDAVANILGLTVKNVSLQTSLAELGMDSMRAVEVKQTLERDFGINLTAKEIRNLTFGRLQELASDDEIVACDKSETTTEGMDYFKDIAVQGVGKALPELQIETKVSEEIAAPKVIVLPGIEGVANAVSPLIEKLECHATALQYGFMNGKDVYDTVERLQPYVQKHITKTEPVRIIAYSFGAGLALETVARLEKEGYKVNILIIEGFPGITNIFAEDIQNDPDMDLKLILRIYSMFAPKQNNVAMEKIAKTIGLENQIREGWNSLLADYNGTLNKHLEQVLLAMHTHMATSTKYQPKFPKIKSPVTLFKASIPALPNLPEDYGLTKHCEHLDIATFDGNHSTVLKNPSLVKAVNQWITHN